MYSLSTVKSRNFVFGVFGIALFVLGSISQNLAQTTSHRDQTVSSEKTDLANVIRLVDQKGGFGSTNGQAISILQDKQLVPVESLNPAAGHLSGQVIVSQKNGTPVVFLVGLAVGSIKDNTGKTNTFYLMDGDPSKPGSTPQTAVAAQRTTGITSVLYNQNRLAKNWSEFIGNPVVTNTSGESIFKMLAVGVSQASATPNAFSSLGFESLIPLLGSVRSHFNDSLPTIAAQFDTTLKPGPNGSLQKPIPVRITLVNLTSSSSHGGAWIGQIMPLSQEFIFPESLKNFVLQ